jgi:hypothetical protein
MLAIRVADRVFTLDADEADGLIRHLERAEPATEELEANLRAALEAGEPANLDQGELAILGIVIESWATEMGVDAGDVQDLRGAIADELV